MLSVRGIEVPGREKDAHTVSQIHSERQVVEEHVRHFLDRVEASISLQQWRQFEDLTTECKNWVVRELAETKKSLDYVLSEQQMKTVLDKTRNLKKELSSVIDEYAIVKPDPVVRTNTRANHMVLGIR